MLVFLILGQIMHFIGGPCTQSHATGLALLRHTLSDGELARMEVRVIGKQGACSLCLALSRHELVLLKRYNLHYIYFFPY